MGYLWLKVTQVTVCSLNISNSVLLLHFLYINLEMEILYEEIYYFNIHSKLVKKYIWYWVLGKIKNIGIELGTKPKTMLNKYKKLD